MATSVFACGMECGVSLAHWGLQSSAATFTTVSPLTGARSLRSAPVASAEGYASTMVAFGPTGIIVFRFSVRFDTLPNASTGFCSVSHGGIFSGPYFNVADNKVYAGSSTGALGATGITVTTGVIYEIDVRVDRSANPHLIDVSVNGAACGQHSNAVAADANARFVLFGFTAVCTADALFDNVVMSATAADFPLGNHYVDCFVPTADGTHNVAGANDFEFSATGTDITNATTTAHTLVDDVPLKSGNITEYINLIAPPNATDYVEVVFGPAPGVATPTVAPVAVEVITVRAKGTGTGANNLRLALNDNGTTDDVFNGDTTTASPGAVYARKHYADPPSAASVWTLSGNGNFNNVRIRCYASDAAPDPWFAGAMIEAAFAVVTVGGKPWQHYAVQMNA